MEYEPSIPKAFPFGSGDLRDAGLARPAVGLRVLWRVMLAAMKPCGLAAEKSWMAARRIRPEPAKAPRGGKAMGAGRIIVATVLKIPQRAVIVR